MIITLIRTLRGWLKVSFCFPWTRLYQIEQSYLCYFIFFSVFLFPPCCCDVVQLFMVLYFQGGKIRAKLGMELSGAEGVVLEEGSAGDGGKAAAQNGMRK